MAFDIFSQPQGANIDVNLFANNANAGIRGGQALGTPLSNAIQGAITGYQQGQQIAQSAANLELTQANIAKTQAEVENIPIQNQLKQQELENQKAITEINQMKAEIARQTQAQSIEAEKAKTQAELQKVQQQKQDSDTSAAIGKALSSQFDSDKLAILNDPNAQAYLAKHPDEAKFVYGSLVNTQAAQNDPELKKRLLGQVELHSQIELEAANQKAQNAANAKVLADYDKTFDTARQDPGIGDIVEATPIPDLVKLRVVDTGMYETDPKTGNLTGKVLSPDLTRPAAYGVFDENGKLIRGNLTADQGAKLKAAQIAEFKRQNAERVRQGMAPLDAPFTKPPSFKDVGTTAPANVTGRGDRLVDIAGDVASGLINYEDLKRGVGVLSGYLTPGTTPANGNTTTQPQAQTPASRFQFALNEEGKLTARPSTTQATVANPTPAQLRVRGLKDIVEGGISGAPVGASQEAATATQEVATLGKEAGASASLIQRAITAVVPSFMQSNIVDEAATPPSLDERASVSQVRNVVDNYAAKAAGESVKTLASGSKEEKDAVRSFAKANDIPLTYQGFKNYYADAANSQLSDVYNKAWDYGVENNAQITRATNAANAIKERAAVQMQSQTVEGSTIGIQPGEISSPITLTQSVQSVASKTGLTPKQTKDTIATVQRVNSVPELADKPIYVKALAAVESAGKANARSTTGVKGYLQVTKRVAGHYGLNRDIPEENALAGQYYIEDLIKEFRGNRELAYAAYNTGPAPIHYAQKLASSSDWKEVKKFLPQALRKYEKAIGVPWEQKIQEVHNYPERVGLYEAIYNGQSES